MLLILVPFAKDLSAQDRIKVVEVNYELSQGHFTPSLAELIVHSNWQTVTSRSLLQDNRPFVIRIPTDAVFKDDSIRILSVASEATISFYRLDGSLTKVRDLLSNADKVHDRLSIELKKTQAINGYFFAEVNPLKAWIPGIQPSSSSGLRLLSTKVEDYDIYSSHFNQKRRWTEEASMLFLLGGIFIMGCYFGILFFSNRSEYIFGIYSAYLFFHSIYWAERITSISLPFFERNVDQLVVNAVSQICFHVAFTLLAHELLNFRAYYPTLSKVWRLFASAQLLFGFLFTVAIYAGADPVLLTNAFTVERLLIGAIALFTTFYFVIRPHNIYCYFFGLASFAFVGSALFAMILGNLKIFGIGLSIEILTFAYAIGHKIRKADESRIEIEKNAFMLEREVIRTKDAALRAQMNPHFVSNVINALRALILDGENKQAYSYLSRFAHVVRTMLSSADKQLISLSEELRLLKDYIALEELRFRRSVSLTIQTAQGIDIDATLIPPMLLQPLVENAMHHGLFSLTERDPQITISIQTEPSTNTLKVSVSDNGIGRYKAKQNQRKRMRKRPSMAMNIIRERINLIRKNADTATQIEAEGVLTIEDLTNQNKVGIGTTVTLRIPKTNLITRDKKRNAVRKFRNPFSLDWKEATQESL